MTGHPASSGRLLVSALRIGFLGFLATFLCACAAHLKDLPLSADTAFALPDIARRGSTMMETLLLKASGDDALRAAEQALASADFESRPESWTADRRCGEYTLGWHEWPFWACIYIRPVNSEQVQARIIVESWTSSGRPPWHLHLATALEGRLRAIQSGR